MTYITRHLPWLVAIVLILSAGCAKGLDLNSEPPKGSSSLGDDKEDLSAAAEPLAWESSSKPERKKWSAYALEVVSREFDFFDQVRDAHLFCRNYDNLSRAKKINFWGQLIAGMSYYESGWKPTSRMHETTMGTDPITGKPVFSEGLLQLSYQDIRWATYCEFDWNRDKHLGPSDPKKTILDPYKNLYCGIRILASQIARKKEITLSSGVYWAVIKEGGKYEKIDEIAAITRKLSFCR